LGASDINIEAWTVNRSQIHCESKERGYNWEPCRGRMLGSTWRANSERWRYVRLNLLRLHMLV